MDLITHEGKIWDPDKMLMAKLSLFSHEV